MCASHHLWVIFVYIRITVLPFAIYTVLEIVPCNEIGLDELSGQSYEEIKKTVFIKKKVILWAVKLVFPVKKFECKSEPKKANLKLYWIIIRPVTTYTYADRTRVLKESMNRKLLTLRRLMSYMYGAPILDISRSHTTTQHSR